ncbi:hypothetical protein [Sphingobium yanoikuyae]|uniref:hypothetical protein n=1 Tax=Sphingobium yanoikuyae TaxID=13690 RepID=UPI002FDEFDCB
MAIIKTIETVTRNVETESGLYAEIIGTYGDGRPFRQMIAEKVAADPDQLARLVPALRQALEENPVDSTDHP